MTIIFAIFALLLIVTSFQSVMGGIRFHRFFSRSLSRPSRGFAPFASVIVPLRGFDDGLEANLEALFSQEYPGFEVIFVTGDEADPCVPALSRFLGTRGARLIYAGTAEGESQKVHNLRVASQQVSERSEVFVFMDSDARPGPGWLSSLVDALAEDGIGVSTGYRWFIPAGGSFASELRACWNASVASRLGEDVGSNFCWGGSTAILRETFEALRITEVWKGTLSDDYALMRSVRRAGLGIAFVPGAMTANVEECGMWELFEFTTRQMKITRVYAQHLWISGLIGSFLFNLVLVWGVALLFVGDDLAKTVSAVSLSLVWGFSVGKAFIRLRAMMLAMPHLRDELRSQTLSQTALWVLTPAVFLYNCVAAGVSREVVWRGIRYRLVSAERTEVV